MTHQKEVMKSKTGSETAADKHSNQKQPVETKCT